MPYLAALLFGALMTHISGIRLDFLSQEHETKTANDAWNSHPGNMTSSFAEMDSAVHVDSATWHALPYCVVADWMDSNRHFFTRILQPDEGADSGYMLYAMCFDQEQKTGWFTTTKHGQQWDEACNLFGGVKGARQFSRESSAERVTELTLARRTLCDFLKVEAQPAFELLTGVYDKYMRQYPDPPKANKRPKPRKPFVFFAAGPPSSGKSMKYISEFDWDMIQSATKTSSGSGGVGALEGRQYVDFNEDLVALINIDRLVETTDIIEVTKKLSQTLGQHLGEYTEAGNPNEKDYATKQSFNEAIIGDLKQLEQHEYWMMRKSMMLDDLNNAHLQRLLALGHDVIYETVFGNRFMSWAENFEFEKMRAAGHELVVMLLQVRLDDIIGRLKERQKTTGQTAAPEEQVVKEIIEGQNNFATKFSKFDYGVAITHVNHGQKKETLLAAFGTLRDISLNATFPESVADAASHEEVESSHVESRCCCKSRAGEDPDGCQTFHPSDLKTRLWPSCPIISGVQLHHNPENTEGCTSSAVKQQNVRGTVCFTKCGDARTLEAWDVKDAFTEACSASSCSNIPPTRQSMTMKK